MHFSQKELVDNQAKLHERDEWHRLNGLDHEAGMAFIVKNVLPLQGRILEIGTGKGRFLVELLRHVPRVTSLDVSDEEQRFARMNLAWAKPGGKARFVVGDATRLPWKNGTFDAVVSVHALHHIKDVRAAVDEAARVTRAHGRIVLADFDQVHMTRLDEAHRQEGRVHEKHAYRLEDVAEHLKKTGWNVSLKWGAGQRLVLASR